MKAISSLKISAELLSIIVLGLLLNPIQAKAGSHSQSYLKQELNPFDSSFSSHIEALDGKSNPLLRSESSWSLAPLEAEIASDPALDAFESRLKDARTFQKKHKNLITREIDSCSVPKLLDVSRDIPVILQDDFTQICPAFAKKKLQVEDAINSHLVPESSRLRDTLSKIFRKSRLKVLQEEDKNQESFAVNNDKICSILMDSPELISWYTGEYPERWKSCIELIKTGSKNDPQLLAYLKTLRETSPEAFNEFLDQISQSNLDTQKRFFNKANSIPPHYLEMVVKGVNQINCTTQTREDKKDCLSIKISDAIDSMSAKLMAAHLSLTFRSVEKTYGVKIFSRQTNPMSLKYLGRGYPSKPKSIKAKTANSGLIAGLIPFDQTLSKASPAAAKLYSDELKQQLKDGSIVKLPLKRDGFYAILDPEAKDGQRWESTAKILDKSGNVKRQYSDYIIHVVGDPVTKLPITGDNDTALIAYLPRDKIKLELYNSLPRKRRDEDNGVESELEAKVRKEINSTFKDAERPGALTNTKALKDIVHHGPDSRNPSHTPIDFPWIDSSGKTIETPQILGDEIRELLAKGYHFYMPEHWRVHLGLGVQNWKSSRNLELPKK